MKITLFSDLHCGESELTCGDRTPALSLDKLRGILSSCVCDGTDLVICLGDFTDGAYAYWMAGAINEDYTKEQVFL